VAFCNVQLVKSVCTQTGKNRITRKLQCFSWPLHSTAIISRTSRDWFWKLFNMCNETLKVALMQAGLQSLNAEVIIAHFLETHARHWAAFAQQTSVGRLRNIADSQQSNMGQSIHEIPWVILANHASFYNKRMSRHSLLTAQWAQAQWRSQPKYLGRQNVWF